MNDLTVTVLWPLAAVVLVLCGAVFATSGQQQQARQQPSPPPITRATIATGVPRAGGRRATDGLPGDRTMVVNTANDQGDALRSVVETARRSGVGVSYANPSVAARFAVSQPSPTRAIAASRGPIDL
jgi:hypothetical protein